MRISVESVISREPESERARARERARSSLRKRKRAAKASPQKSLRASFLARESTGTSEPTGKLLESPNFSSQAKASPISQAHKRAHRLASLRRAASEPESERAGSPESPQASESLHSRRSREKSPQASTSEHKRASESPLAARAPWYALLRCDNHARERAHRLALRKQSRASQVRV